MGHLFMLAALLLALPAHAVTIDWVTVGDPGNAVDFGSGYGGITRSGSFGVPVLPRPDPRGP